MVVGNIGYMRTLLQCEPLRAFYFLKDLIVPTSNEHMVSINKVLGKYFSSYFMK